MTTGNLHDVLYDVVQKQYGPQTEPPYVLLPTTHFDTDLGFDSLDLVECVMELEERLGLSDLDESAFYTVTTLAEAEDVLTRLVAAFSKGPI